MNLTDQVCSLEYAKKLKELGIAQSSLFYWVKPKSWERHRDPPEFTIEYIHWFDELQEPLSLKDYETYSAFTVAELGELLPECIPYEGDLMMWNNMNFQDQRYFGIEYTGSGLESFTAETEANVRAMMLIYLYEQGIVKMTKPTGIKKEDYIQGFNEAVTKIIEYIEETGELYKSRVATKESEVCEMLSSNIREMFLNTLVTGEAQGMPENDE